MYVGSRIFFSIVKKICGNNIGSILHRRFLFKKLKKRYKLQPLNPMKQESCSSNYVWIFWWQGEENAPDLVKSCIRSVKSALSNGHDIRIISKNNLNDYVSLPNYILKKMECGIIPMAHFSDIVRIALLMKYGGYWFDSTCLVAGTEIFEIIEQCSLFALKELDLSSSLKDIAASNWFLYSKSNNCIIIAVYQILCDYWKNTIHLDDYYIFHVIFKVAISFFEEEWKEVPTFNNRTPHTLQFELNDRFNENRWQQIIKMSDIHKLNRRVIQNKSSEKTFLNYIVSTY